MIYAINEKDRKGGFPQIKTSSSQNIILWSFTKKCAGKGIQLILKLRDNLTDSEIFEGYKTNPGREAKSILLQMNEFLSSPTQILRV